MFKFPILTIRKKTLRFMFKPFLYLYRTEDATFIFMSFSLVDIAKIRQSPKYAERQFYQL